MYFQRLSGKFHDKNFVTDDQLRIAGRLRRKHNQNARLSSMQSTTRPPLEHHLSWNPEDTEVCVRRTSEAQIKLGDRAGGKAHTVDFSGSPEHGDKMPHFELELENVFEDDERSETDEDPLLDKTPEEEKESKGNGRQKKKEKVKKSDSDQHGGLFRQDAMKEEQNPNDSVEIQMKEISDQKLAKQKSL